MRLIVYLKHLIITQNQSERDRKNHYACQSKR